MALDPLCSFLGQEHNELLQHHFINASTPISPANIYLCHHKGSTTFDQIQGPEVLSLLHRAKADSLEYGSLEIFIQQEILDWQLLGGLLHFPQKQRNKAHQPVLIPVYFLDTQAF